MRRVFCKPESLTDAKTIYCAGCGHGIIHRLIAEVIDELKIREKTIGVMPVGCAVLGYDYFNFDCTEAAHGRAPAVATGIKRVRPDSIVFTYQGDGDLAAIGTAEIIHAAARGEKITVIFVNNALYGMTGGQMAPTTLLKQKTSTTPAGRNANMHGYPIKITELLSGLDGSVYLARGSVDSPQNIQKTKKLVKRAFETQILNLGFSLVEILSMCPTNWRTTPTGAIKFIQENLIPYYQLAVFKEKKEN